MSTQSEIHEAKELYAQGNSQRKVAEILSARWNRHVGRSTVKDWLNGQVPLNEHTNKIQEATAEQCCDELRRIVQIEPSKFITAMYFQEQSRIANSAWKQHFGTFAEYKRQAGVTASRHVHTFGLNIAKHASLDKLREFNVEKRDWSGRFLKPNGKRFKTMLNGSDIHDIECDPFWRFLFIETARRVQPDSIVLNGDVFDLPEFGKYDVDPREWNVVGRIKWVHKFLEDIREASPDSEITMIEGNHEFRLLRHLCEASPVMKAVLSDLLNMTVPDLLGLTKYEINYIAPADLGTITKADAEAELRRNFKLHHDFYVTCHFPDAKAWGMPGTNGHHHNHLVSRHYNPLYGSYEWHQTGAGHKREASYCNAEKWSLGFLINHFDTEKKFVQQDYIDIGDHAVIGGKWYTRDDVPV